jgi:hypothetical protein
LNVVFEILQEIRIFDHLVARALVGILALTNTLVSVRAQKTTALDVIAYQDDGIAVFVCFNMPKKEEKASAVPDRDQKS